MPVRLRRSNLFFGVALTFGCVLFIYIAVDTISQQFDEAQLQKTEILAMSEKLKGIEDKMMLNRKTISMVQDSIAELVKEQSVMREEAKNVRNKGRSLVNRTLASVSAMDFAFAAEEPAKCDVQLLQVYDQLKFDNPDGGVWKQGWDIAYDQNQALEPRNKLKVFVMPHSHNDPGWTRTFEDYYRSQTKHILDNAVIKLSEDSRRKFVWAEISYLALWWLDLPQEKREAFKKLVSNGQIEILTGGWVMPDEANSHLYSLVEQLILGHEWLRINLGPSVKPNNGWAIDPFGLSPTMAFLLKRSGFENMVIQRTHYSVKKHLAKSKDLEFMWRQHWAHDETTDMMTHMMPFFIYDIPHTCGPDPKVCCQFDFVRQVGGMYTCPWKVPSIAINDANVAERSRTLLDQYRKKAQLFKTSSVLIPLGDDFRYSSAKEWDEQFSNYQKIFDYVNNHPELNADLQFGTLQDYFQSVRNDLESSDAGKSAEAALKTIGGDFFTYADRDEHYWSGYYTSRPFHKNMDRVLAGYVRATEILFSLVWAEMEYVGSDLTDMTSPMMNLLITARERLALFQHHDGVTGTAKDHVVVDYGKKMLEGIESCQKVMSQGAHYLLSKSKTFYKPNFAETWFDLDDFRERHDSLPEQTVLQVNNPDIPSRVVIFNSMSKYRSETVTFKVSTSKVRIYKVEMVEGEDEEETIPCQISPLFDSEGQIVNNVFRLSFLAQVKAFGLKVFYLAAVRPEEGDNVEMDVATVRIFNSALHPFQAPPFDDPEVFEKSEGFTLQNGYVKAQFDSFGMLQAITTLTDNVMTDVKLGFARYTTHKSGAYLFLPNGPAKPIPISDPPLIRIIEGKVMSQVQVHLPWVLHIVTLFSSPGPDGIGIKIENVVDVRKMRNEEVVMRFTTGIQSGQDFFTDLNAFQMIRRRRQVPKLPIQANYYPMPSMAYIQDSTSRLSIISKQPLGCTSLESGQLEVMLERRLAQDDELGVGQGVLDNRVTSETFYLLLERKTQGCTSDEPKGDSAASYPSLPALSLRDALINPTYRLLYASNTKSLMSHSYTPVGKELSCDIDVVTLRTMLKATLKPADEVVMVLHRQGFNPCFKPFGLTCSTNGGTLSIQEIFPEIFGEKVMQSSLTLLYDGLSVQKGFTVSIKPMELYAFLLRRGG